MIFFFLFCREGKEGTEISVKCAGRVLQEEVNSQPITLREFVERVNEL